MNIPDEAIEATAEALAIAHYEDDDVWRSGGPLTQIARKRWRAQAIGVLMPAAPILMAKAWSEGMLAGLHSAEYYNAPINPYRPARADLRADQTFTHTRLPGTVPRAAEDKTTHPQGEQ